MSRMIKQYSMLAWNMMPEKGQHRVINLPRGVSIYMYRSTDTVQVKITTNDTHWYTTSLRFGRDHFTQLLYANLINKLKMYGWFLR